jgi:hypothetical protein
VASESAGGFVEGSESRLRTNFYACRVVRSPDT